MPIFIFPNEILTFYVTIEAYFAFTEHYPMKLKTCHTNLLAATLLMLLPLGVLAQESRSGFDPDAAKDPARQEQETPAGEGLEIRSNIKNITVPAPETPVVRDSEIKNSKPVAKQPAEKPQKEVEKPRKEEDPLSFNFLYYIIEKFKLSDIVE